MAYVASGLQVEFGRGNYGGASVDGKKFFKLHIESTKPRLSFSHASSCGLPGTRSRKYLAGSMRP